MTARGLDFLGIGAVKAGTTSLFQYMRTHPELYLPGAKEQQFFTDDDLYFRGWDDYVSYAFFGAPTDRLWGKVTPQYLGGAGRWHESTLRQAREDPTVIVPGRIAELFPGVKLIVLLRDPVDRAISQYWMLVLLGDEQRSLAEAIRESLMPSALAEARIAPTRITSYVSAGEYGRLLAGYLKFFPRSQLFVASTERLAGDPEALVRSLWEFLGVDETHIPSNLRQRYLTRSERRRFPWLDPWRVSALVEETPALRAIWNAVPAQMRNRIRVRYRTAAYRVWVHRWNRAPAAPQRQPPDPGTVAHLRAHYEADLARLRELIGPVPGVTDPGGPQSPVQPRPRAATLRGGLEEIEQQRQEVGD